MSLDEVSQREDGREVRVPPRAAQADSGQLPAWTSVLAVVAHPDDESMGLGAVLDSFVGAGARVSVLSFTPGGGSTTTGVTGDLSALRGVEFQRAARVLGVGTAILAEHRDGQLGRSPGLAREVVDAASRTSVDGLLVFDLSGVSGHPDHTAATAAALEAADALGLLVLGWTLPADIAHQLNHERGTSFIGTEPLRSTSSFRSTGTDSTSPALPTPARRSPPVCCGADSSSWAEWSTCAGSARRRHPGPRSASTTVVGTASTSRSGTTW